MRRTLDCARPGAAFLVLLSLLFLPSLLPAGPQVDQSYLWASKPIEGRFEGFAQQDLNGDGQEETLLLSRRVLVIGSVRDKVFQESFRCSWSTAAEAGRIDLFDVDGDGRDEVVISAVEEGLPSSLVLSVDAEKKTCRERMTRVRWMLRATMVPEEGNGGSLRRVLAGQTSTSQTFFSGAVREMDVRKGRLHAGKKVSLPRTVSIYQFTFLPTDDDTLRVAILKGFAPLEVYERPSGKWRRIWRSPERLGGSSNQLPAPQRPALDQLSGEFMRFDLPPLWVGSPGQGLLVSVKQELPLKDAVGRQSFIRGARLMAYAADEALGFTDAWTSLHLPGPVLDLMLTTSGDRLGVLMQQDAGAFEETLASTMFAFDLH
jgi:hypothetical protein